MPRAESWPKNLGAVPTLTFARAARVLVALPEGDRRELLTEALSGEGYEVETAGTVSELKGRLAGSVLAGEPFDLLVLDLEAPGTPILEVLTHRELGGSRLILVARTISEPLNREAARLRAVIVESTSSPQDLRDCAIMLVSPVRVNERPRTP